MNTKCSGACHGRAFVWTTPPMENLFGLLKQKMYYGEPPPTYQELKRAIET